MVLEILSHTGLSADVAGGVDRKVTTLQQVRKCALDKGNSIQAVDCQVRIGQLFYENGQPVDAESVLKIALSELGGIKSSNESTQTWLEGQGKQVVGLLEEIKQTLAG